MRSSRIDYEKKVIAKMVSLYCRHHEGNKTLCDTCRRTLAYADTRLTYCRYGENKTTCKKCPTHCYSPAMKAEIKKIMRWSGPRMIIYHPIDALRHILREAF